MFFIFLLSSVISLIWSSLLPQWTSQRRLKSSVFSTYDNGFSNFNWKLHKIYKKKFFHPLLFYNTQLLTYKIEKVDNYKGRADIFKVSIFLPWFFLLFLKLETTTIC